MVLNEVLHKDSVHDFKFTYYGSLGDVDDAKIAAIVGEKKVKIMPEYRLGSNYPNIHFSRREAECMAKLLQNKLVREVADELELSVRTAEYYVMNMRRKLDCKTKVELMHKVVNSDFLDLLKKSDLAHIVV